MFDFLSPKYVWDFYEPKGFSDKEWVCSRRLTANQAVKMSMDKGWLYEIRLGGAGKGN